MSEATEVVEVALDKVIVAIVGVIVVRGYAISAPGPGTDDGLVAALYGVIKTLRTPMFIIVKSAQLGVKLSASVDEHR